MPTDQQVTRTRTRQQNTRQQNKPLTHEHDTPDSLDERLYYTAGDLYFFDDFQVRVTSDSFPV